MGKTKNFEFEYDDSSSGRSGVQSDTEGSRSAKASQDDHHMIAKKEDIQIRQLRIFVFFVLVASTTLVGFATFYYTSNAEKEEFEEQFKEDAVSVLRALSTSLDKTLGGVDAFVVSMLSYARDTNQTWPFVTIPDFESRSQKFLALTKAMVFMQCILITPETRPEWEAYTAKHGRAWAEESIAYLKENDRYQDVYERRNITEAQYLDFIHDYSAWGVDNPKGLPNDYPGPMLPMWQSAPLIPTTPVYNWDLATVEENESVLASITKHRVSISKAYHIANPGDTSLLEENLAWADYFSNYITNGEDPMEPLSDFYYPMIVDSLDNRIVWNDDYHPEDHQVVGILSQSVYWRDLIKNTLPIGSDGIIAVFEGPCNPTFTYEINGPNVKYLGVGDFHESKYDYLEESSLFQDLDKFLIERSYTGIPLEQELCPWTIRLFPSGTFETSYTTDNKYIFTIAAVLIFGFTSAVFLVYDWYVERRQKIVMDTAVKSSKIVSSIFPQNVRERLYDTATKAKKSMRSNILAGVAENGECAKTESLPIADLFPEATVLFADIAGFTAWSSTRDPVQVFTLLEAIYGAFDKIAKRRGVFKVETIGDCYVAVCGLPEPRKNHAAVMVRFASKIRDTMNTLTTELELQLGPGTSELKLRIGLHSGAVTAGVLRGDKGRFQLFGDTVNTASRMESNGMRNRIQVSQKTANYLIAEGKESWLTKREDKIQAKGKGELQAFWAEPKTTAQSSTGTGESSDAADIDEFLKIDIVTKEQVTEDLRTKIDMLVEWNVTIVEEFLKKLISHRQDFGRATPGFNFQWTKGSTTVRDEVVPCIGLPAFRKAETFTDFSSIKLHERVSAQVRTFVHVVSRMYHMNPFHNFEHASHVTMSSKKLLNRITNMSNTLSQQEIYIHSFGIAMDPLAQLAIIFSALVHDVDHRGIINPVLAREFPSLAAKYKSKSVAEQNSVDLAWDLLMEPDFTDLRSCMFTCQADLDHFRQFVVNAVMATDIFDPDLKKMRDERWRIAFLKSAKSDDPDALNRKATIVLEHVIQASDICHTMQHWRVYQIWNHKLFAEMYKAFKEGRLDNDPSKNWYEGELNFFDTYVIPLARKLKECQVFGASGHEFLDSAYENRNEWEEKGKEIVERLAEDLKRNSFLYD